MRKAIAKQNGLTADRDVSARLAERWIEIDRLAAKTERPGTISDKQLATEIRHQLKRPEVADLLTTAMSIDDAVVRGMTRISIGFDGWCHQVAETIANQPMTGLRSLIEIDPETPALNRALNAIWNGVLAGLESPANRLRLK